MCNSDFDEYENHVYSGWIYISTTIKNFLEKEINPNKRKPNHIFKAVCAALLEKYPVEHPGWGYDKIELKLGNEKDPRLTYNLVKHFGKGTHRTWSEIEKITYDIAHASEAFDIQPSPISEALRSLRQLRAQHRPFITTRKKVKTWEHLTICKYCWRLAPSAKKNDITLVKYQGKTFFNNDKSVCDKHSRKNSEYHKSYRIYLEVTSKLHESYTESGLPKHSEKKELINIVFPLSPSIKADLHPNTLKKLELFYPLTFTYIREKGYEPTNFKQLVDALLGDSANDGHNGTLPNKAGINAVKKEIENIIINPTMIAGHIEHCEVWLSIYAKHKHGGKRRGD